MALGSADHRRRVMRGRAICRAVGQQVRIGAVLLVMMMMVMVVMRLARLLWLGAAGRQRLDDTVDRDHRAEGRTGGAEPLQVIALLRPGGEREREVAHLVDIVVDLVEVP